MNLLKKERCVITPRLPMNIVSGDKEKWISVPFISAIHAIHSRTTMVALYVLLQVM